jgi:AcrR family transcriptional regulator
MTQIILAARQTFQEDGYAGSATRRVAGRVGITLGNLQYYFRTKEELLRAALQASDDLLRSTIGALGKSYLDRYAEMGKPSRKPALERPCEIVENVLEEARDPRVHRPLD